MGTRILLILALVFAAPSARADTNSWIYGGNDLWDTGVRWSLHHYPTITNEAVLITNSASKTVTIDSFIPLLEPDALTISNLTVGGTGGASNTLSLSDMNTGGPIPLLVLNGFAVTTNGILLVTNSMLRVDGILGGDFKVDGTVQMLQQADVQVNEAIFSTNSVVQFALGTTSSTIVVGNNLTIGGTVNAIDGGGFTATNYTLFSYGGTLVDNGLAVGTLPTNYVGVIDTGTVGQVNLVVSIAPPPTPSTFRITSIERDGDNIAITWLTTGTGTSNIVQAAPGDANGSFTTNFVNLSPPMLITGSTTNYTDIGGATNRPSRFYRIQSVSAQGIVTDSDHDGLPDSWELKYFGDLTSQDGTGDPDGDGFNNLQEYLADTDPTRPASFFHIIAIARENTNDVRVTWTMGDGRTNALQRTGGDAGSYTTNGFVDIFTVTNTVGSVTNYLDVGGATNVPSQFYRVRVVP
ncbi:MAG TPA: hypothetical protein VL486_14750 [Verrucomicrobiae bacterium]|nr:hypothetical protein [Verrucomicrobiae bacterium]